MDNYGGLSAGVIREYLPAASRGVTDSEINNYLKESIEWAKNLIGVLPEQSPLLVGAIRDLTVSMCYHNIYGVDNPEGSQIADRRRDDAIKRIKSVGDSAPRYDSGSGSQNTVDEGGGINTIPGLWDMGQPLVPKRYYDTGRWY